MGSSHPHQKKVPKLKTHANGQTHPHAVSTNPYLLYYKFVSTFAHFVETKSLQKEVFILKIPVLLTLILAAATLPAQSPDTILKRVDDHYNHLRTLQAHYSEHYTGMGMDRTESGTLQLKKPGRMKWSYATPAGKVFILDGKAGWFYTPGDPQAQRVSAKQLDDLRSPLRYLLGHTQLQKELDSPTVHPTPGGYQIAGVPKGMNQRVRNLTLDVDSNGLIIAMSLEEVDGATTTFTFSVLRENVPIPDATFTFTPPPGVTVVNGLPPI